MLNAVKPIGTGIKKLIKPRTPFENELLEKIWNKNLLRIDNNNNNNNNITLILMKGVLQSHMSSRLFTPHQ